MSLLVAAAALVDTDGRVLLTQRPEGKSFAGCWEFPGGKIEQGETPESAIIRELMEELGVNTIESCLAPAGFASHAYDDFHLILLLYICRRWQGTARSCENNPIVWVQPNRMREYPMPEANGGLVAVLQDLL